MRRALLALAAAGVSGCLFQPDLSRFPECAAGDTCAPGATCVQPERRCIPDCLGATCPSDGAPDAGPDAGEPLPFAAVGLDAGVELQPFEHVFTVDGGTPPYRFATLVPLPPGMSLSDAGLFWGAPHDAGVFTLTPEVEDSSSPPLRGAVELRWEVRPLLRLAGPRLLADAVAGLGYQEALSSTGGVPPFVYRVVDGGLPSGLSLSADGGVTGSPDGSSAGVAFEVRVEDSAVPPQQAQLPITISVDAYNPLQALEIQTRALPEGRIGEPYRYRIQAHGGLEPYTWSIGNLPDGLTVTGSLISGVPEQRVSNRNINVQVTDSALTPDSQSANFPLTIR